MLTQIQKGLICDLQSGSYNGKPYNSLLCYEQGRLYRVSVTEPRHIDLIAKNLSKYASITCDLKTFDGKNKFTLNDIRIQEA